MGVDSLSIVSMNSSRKGLFSLPPSHRTKYLQDILNNAEPEICFLPGDKGETRKDVVIGYQQYMTETNNASVILFKNQRIQMKNPKFNLNSIGPLPGISYEDIVCPFVEVETLAPNPKSVIKQFSAISWHYQMLEYAVSQGKQTQMSESLVIFAQRVALTTGNPVLICGEFPITFNEIMKIIREQNKFHKTGFLEDFQQHLGPQGFLPSMTNGATRELRHKFELEVFRCKAFEKKVSLKEEEVQVPDFFLASKELELKEPSLINFEHLTGRKVQMKALQKYCPTKTHMDIPVRPPRHHGG